MKKHVHEKIDTLSKVIGFILIVIGIEYVTKVNWSLAVAYIGGGALISISPFFVKIE
ncbi:MAG: hypothetical protein V3R93_06180 [Candidatus Hydrothermarchaeaceae archaeon]